jgi:hypothetical protein
MGVNVQRGARLGVSKQVCYCADIHILRDQKAGVVRAWAVDVQ